jgi:hypothetical protein
MFVKTNRKDILINNASNNKIKTDHKKKRNAKIINIYYLHRFLFFNDIYIYIYVKNKEKNEIRYACFVNKRKINMFHKVIVV